jgi:predicted phage terminase large subunit-like protein
VWEQILHTLPVKLRRVHQSDSKEVRAARVLNFYQRGRVIHAKPLRELEEQMCAFPKAPHDDMLDSVVSAVERFLNPPKQQQPPNAARASYL